MGQFFCQEAILSDIDALVKIINTKNEFDAINYLESHPDGNYLEMIESVDILDAWGDYWSTETNYKHNLLSFAIVCNLEQLAIKLLELNIFNTSDIVRVENIYGNRNSPITYYKNFDREYKNISETNMSCNVLYLAILHEHTNLIQLIIQDLKKNNTLEENLDFKPKLYPVETDDTKPKSSKFNNVCSDSYDSMTTRELLNKYNYSNMLVL